MSLPIWSRCLALFAVALLGAILASPGHACSSAKLTLQQLIDGDSFSSENGLYFGDFDAVIGGDLASQIDPSEIKVILLEDGFRLTGPMSTVDGETGDILLSYVVSAVSVLSNTGSDPLGIIEASLRMKAKASGDGAEATVDEEISSADLPTPVVLSTEYIGGDKAGAVLFESVAFAEPLFEIEVEKLIQLDSSLPGGIARIQLIDQRFAVVPEPGTLALIGLGLTGLAGLGRKRTH